MAESSDWLPGTRAERLAMAKKWQTLLADNAVDWLVPAAKVTELGTAVSGFESAAQAAVDDDTTHNIEAARVALVGMVRSMRFMKSHYFLIPPLTAQDYLDLIGKSPDHIRTSVPPPSSIPELKLDSSIIRQIKVYFRDSGSDRRGKPAGVHGIELRWALLDHWPVDISELINSDGDTASPFTLVFSDADRGKSLYICPRWENGKVQKGPWGEIVMAIVP